jgi:hypothetical protein
MAWADSRRTTAPNRPRADRVPVFAHFAPGAGPLQSAMLKDAMARAGQPEKAT